jgi:hypothetical protein
MCIFNMCFQQSSECSLQNIYRLSEVSKKRIGRVRNICCKLAINLLQACSKDLEETCTQSWCVSPMKVVKCLMDINGKLFLYYMCICINFLYISFCAYILQHSSLNLLSLHYSNKEHDWMRWKTLQRHIHIRHKSVWNA